MRGTFRIFDCAGLGPLRESPLQISGFFPREYQLQDHDI